MIEVENLTKNYEGHWAVRGVSFGVAEGDIFGFIGPNGAGKTTSIRIISTLLDPTSGSVKVGGRSVTGEAEAVRRLIGFMPDNFGVYERITVWEYLDFFAAAYGLDRRPRAAAIEGIMELTDLLDLRDRLTGELSKGMRQRLCLAKTLVHDPKVLILDEPANGLDPRARIEFRALLKELRSMGKTILISSHILAEMNEFCTSVAIMERGQMVVSGRIDEVNARIMGESFLSVEVLGDPEPLLHILAGDERAGPPERKGNALEFRYRGGADEASDLLTRLVGSGVRVASFARRKENLEELFLKVGARELS